MHAETIMCRRDGHASPIGFSLSPHREDALIFRRRGFFAYNFRVTIDCFAGRILLLRRTLRWPLDSLHTAARR